MTTPKGQDFAAKLLVTLVSERKEDEWGMVVVCEGRRYLVAVRREGVGE